MNWTELAIGFAAGCAYSSTVTFILAWADRRAAIAASQQQEG